MSFSVSVKEELCTLPVRQPCCASAELAAVLLYGGRYKDGVLTVRSDRAQSVQRLAVLLKKTCGYRPEMTEHEGKRAYSVAVPADLANAWGLYYDADGSIALDEEVYVKDCCKRAFLRGAFLMAGTITAPSKTYHAELATYNEFVAQLSMELLESFSLSPRLSERKGNSIVYLKDAESIGDLLNILGAHQTMMAFLDARIEKDLRNNTNRKVNCETANLDKTVTAAVMHQSAIRRLVERGGWEAIPESLRPVAQLRLEHSEIGLAALGALLEPPLSKSGVNHRLKRLMQLADEIEG